MLSIDELTQEVLALPKDLKLQLLGQLAENLELTIEKQTSANRDLQTFMKSQAFFEKLEMLKQQMQEEEIEVNPSEIWGDVRDKEAGREVTLP